MKSGCGCCCLHVYCPKRIFLRDIWAQRRNTTKCGCSKTSMHVLAMGTIILKVILLIGTIVRVKGNGFKCPHKHKDGIW